MRSVRESSSHGAGKRSKAAIVPKGWQRSPQVVAVSVQPILDPQAGHFCEIVCVAGQECGVVGQRDTSDLQIQGADADPPDVGTPKACRQHQRPKVELSSRQNLDLPLKLCVGGDLAMQVAVTAYFCEPATQK